MGDVRITSGRWRGRRLETPEGEATRPLLTRLRKSLGDLLRPVAAGARVLDLFGGSGAISLELLSDGAAEAVIIDRDPKAARAAAANVRMLDAPARVMEGDALAVMERLSASGERFDLVVVAPPYFHELHLRAMERLSTLALLRPGGLAVVQRDRREPFFEAKAPFVFERTRDYGRTLFDFYRFGEPG